MSPRYLPLLAAALGLTIAFVAGNAYATARGSCQPASAAQLRGLPTRGVLRADVDGDGAIDTAGLSVDARRGLRCRFTVWVRTGRGLRATLVEDAQLEDSNGHPSLEEIARISRGRGAQLVVDFGIGAAVDSYGLYTLAGNRLVRVRVPQAAIADTFEAGGSANGGVGTICADGAGSGTVIEAGTHAGAATKVPSIGTLYEQLGASYRFVSRRHRLTRVEQRSWRAPGNRYARIFSNCAVAARH